MNHKNITISMAAIVAVVAVTAVGFAVPQQALAGGHHHNNDNGIRVNQDISQLNACSNFTTCINDATNNADVHR